MAPVLMCASLRRNFPGSGRQLEVLKGVDLLVDPAQVVAILGPSGSGKSTLLHLLAGLDSPSAGEIFWGEFPVHAHRPSQLAWRRSRILGLIFQQHFLLEDLSALDNVTLPGRIFGKLDTAWGKELLDAVGLAERSDFLPRLLSVGERQRVAVARALYSRPRVILADEPTGSLDRENAGTVYRLLVGLARDSGSAVVLVTHDQELVRDADRQLFLLDGVLRADGSGPQLEREV